MSGTYTLPPYGGQEDPSFEVPVVTEGYHPSLHYNNQMYETTQLTDLTGDYSRTAGTSSESAEDSNPEGHPAGEDGVDFHYGEPVLQGFHTSDPAGRPEGEQVLTGYYGASNPSNMSPIPSFDPSGRARAVRFQPTVSTSVAEGGRRSVLSTSHSSRMQSRGGPQVHLT
jgi:hypothetical protein